jgi:hypothetical protein
MPCVTGENISRRGVLRGAAAGALGAYTLGEAPPGVRALGPSTAQSSGGQGLSLGGPEQPGYAEAESTPSLNLPDDAALTVECWVRHNGTSAEDAILVDKSAGGDGYRLAFDGQGEEPRLRFYYLLTDDTAYSVVSERGIPAGRWTHVAATYDGSEQAVYIDGELDATNESWSNQDVDETDAALTLGTNSAASERFVSGEIDEVRVWNTARELLELQGNMFTRLSGDEEGLMAYWPLDGSLADRARSNDLSTTGNAAVAGWGAFPLPPTLYARAGDGAVELEWTPRGADEFGIDRYWIYRSTAPDGSDRGAVTGVEAGTTSVTVDAPNDEVAYYWIEAVDGDGNRSGLSYPAIAFPSGNPAGRALGFDGGSSHAVVGDRPSLDMIEPAQLTVECWVKRDGSGDGDGVLVSKDANDARAYEVSLVGSGAGAQVSFALLYTDDDAYAVQSASSIPAGEWTHVACTYDGSRQAIYIDGELDATNDSWSDQQVGNDASLRLGVASSEGSGFFAGQLDEVRVWNAALGGSQINEVRRQELFGNEAGLVGYWRTCDGETLYGSVGTALTGTLNDVACDASTVELAQGSEGSGTAQTPSGDGPSRGTPSGGGTATPTGGSDTPTGTPSDGPTPTDAPTPSPTPGGGSQGAQPTSTAATPTPGGGSGRGFLFNGDRSIVGFVNETILTVVGIVVSIMGMLYQMIGGD